VLVEDTRWPPIVGLVIVGLTARFRKLMLMNNRVLNGVWRVMSLRPGLLLSYDLKYFLPLFCFFCGIRCLALHGILLNDAKLFTLQ
jgi:hypothetical protein